MFNTNVLGLLNATRTVLPYMRQQRSGTIALFGSIGSWHGSPASGMYCATKWAVSALAETMRAELAAFNVSVCAIEPGYFRTGFLNSGARVQTQQRIEDYDKTTVGEVRAMLDRYDNKQLGDLNKGAKVIVDVLSLTGVKEVPMRLVLGSDARKGIEEKCNGTLKLLNEYRDITDSTDYPDGE